MYYIILYTIIYTIHHSFPEIYIYIYIYIYVYINGVGGLGTALTIYWQELARPDSDRQEPSLVT